MGEKLLNRAEKLPIDGIDEDIEKKEGSQKIQISKNNIFVTCTKFYSFSNPHFTFIRQ